MILNTQQNNTHIAEVLLTFHQIDWVEDGRTDRTAEKCARPLDDG